MSTNPYLERLDDLEQARNLWQQSEFRLNFLRTESGTKLMQPTEEEILQWYHDNQLKTPFPNH